MNAIFTRLVCAALAAVVTLGVAESLVSFGHDTRDAAYAASSATRTVAAASAATAAAR
jgi:hypothetical protein